MSDLALYFLMYVMLFRLAIIAVGMTSIVLGYRLFCKGIWGEKSGEGGSGFDAKIGPATVTFQNAAPGTFFALFGVITIGFMFVHAPELSLETLQQVTAPPRSSESPPVKMIMRGGEANFSQALEEQIHVCEEAYEEKQLDQAIAACREITSVKVLNLLAWMYQAQHQLEMALPLAQAAIALDDKNSDVLHTVAIIWCKKQQYEEASQWLNKAIALESDAEIKQRFTADLENFRQQKCEVSN